jgi:hypothetical protein
MKKSLGRLFLQVPCVEHGSVASPRFPTGKELEGSVASTVYDKLTGLSSIFFSRRKTVRFITSLLALIAVPLL